MKFTAVIAILASALMVSVAAAPVDVKNSVARTEVTTKNPAGPTVATGPEEKSVKSYIIVLKNTVETQDIATAEREIVKVGGTIQYRYTNVLKGFSAWLSTRAVKSLTANPLVDYIEEDQQVHTLPSSTQPEAQ